MNKANWEKKKDQTYEWDTRWVSDRICWQKETNVTSLNEKHPTYKSFIFLLK